MKDEVIPVLFFFFLNCSFFCRERSKLKSAHDLECRYGLHSHRLNGTPPFSRHYLSLASPEINKTCAVVAVTCHCEMQSILLVWQNLTFYSESDVKGKRSSSLMWEPADEGLARLLRRHRELNILVCLKSLVRISASELKTVRVCWSSAYFWHIS